MESNFTKQEKSWILYDVANSAFILLVSTTIPIFFRSLAEAAGIDPTQASGLWALTTSIAVLIMAVLSPILGALADYRGMKKKLFCIFLAFGIISLLSLSIVNDWLAYMIVFLMSRIGYTACNIFYDSMLTDVSSDEHMDLVSSYGYALGYIGSCIPFVIGVALIFIKPFGLTTAMATQVSFLITAIWWLVVSIPLIKNVKQNYYLDNRKDKVKHSFIRLNKTFKKILADKKMKYFILAYFCYIDGVYTIISMATTYGGEVGISSTNMILALLLTQVVAFPFAIFSAKLAQKFNTLKVISFYILVYCGICIFGYNLNEAWEFWVLAIAVGMAQGGIQSLSRSYFGRLVPKEESNEYFGFFDIFGKFADFFGPLIMSFCAFVFGSSNIGILCLLILFITGYVLIRKIPS